MVTASTTHSARASVRLTPAERDQLDQLAWDRRIPLSELLRVGVAHVLADPDSAPRRVRVGAFYDED